MTKPAKRTAMTDQIPLPPPDYTEDVHGFVHDTERRYYSEQTMRAYAECLHDARVKTLPTQLMAGLQAEVDALRHQLQTLAELGDASGDAQILRMGYAAARLEIESLNTQLQTAREEIERRDAQLEAIGAGAASSAVGATSTAVENKMDIEEAIEHAEERAGDCSTDCRQSLHSGASSG